jgi:hypothetical protein
MKERREQQAELLAGLAEFRPKMVDASADNSVSHAGIVQALQSFMECIRYLNVRRSKGLQISIESEADVQDLLYLMLRPWITDLIYENPTGKVGNRYAVKDFLSAAARTVVEAKYVRDASHGRSISKELHDDIEMYRRHPTCDHVVFFVYDADSQIADRAALRADIESNRVYDGRPLHCHLIVCP